MTNARLMVLVSNLLQFIVRHVDRSRLEDKDLVIYDMARGHVDQLREADGLSGWFEAEENGYD